MMRLAATLLITSALLAGAGCGAGIENRDQGAQTSAPAGGTASAPASAPQEKSAEGTIQKVSLSQADQSQAAPVPVERKVIRNAALTVEAEAPAEAMRRIASVAEARGGFVVTSESRQHGGSGEIKPYEVITLDLRVPAAQFDAVIQEVRAAGSRVIQEKITGQDVTEEYIDLEARIRTQKALEAQLFEIMKGARAVTDALAVQRELANVRTEIERLEGRRRFLENQTSLSTVRITLQPPAQLVSASGFFQSLREAFGDGIDVAAGITLGLIRVGLALIPVVLFVLLPLALLVRFALRRARRRRPPVQQPPVAAEVRSEPEPADHGAAR